MNKLRVPSWWAALGMGCLVGLMSLTSSCGRPLAEVEGVVTLEGLPLPDIEVVFVPDAEQGVPGACAWAVTDAEGRYRLVGSRGEPRCVAGTHRVCLRDLQAVRPPSDAEKPASENLPPSRVPLDYSDPQTTPLRSVEVKPGKQTLDFDVPITRES